MAKEGLVEADGVITEVMPDARFRVHLDLGQDILAYMSGRMRKHRIRILAGDRVTVEMTPYDLDKGRITYRFKNEPATALSPGQRSQSRPLSRRRPR